MKKILFICYFFPPAGGAGVQRVSKFIKYLERFGWQSFIICPEEDVYLVRDDTLLEDIAKNISVNRIKFFEVFLKLSKVSWKLYNFFTKWFCIPDDKKTFMKEAHKRACNLIKKEKIKILFTTSFPCSTHLVGLRLKDNFPNLKWIADFRDEWSETKEKFPTSWHYKKNKNLEKEVLKKADKIITVSEPLKGVFINDFPEIKNLKTRFRVITNGFDLEDFEKVFERTTAKNNKDFTISYIGTVYNKQSPENFLLGIKQFLEDERYRIKIRFIGATSKAILKILKKLGLKNNSKIEVLDYVNHKDVLKMIVSSDLLLLIIGKSIRKGVYTGKIFEYIASKVPIFALVPKHDVAAELIRKTRTGVIVDPEDKKEIRNFFLDLYNK